MKKIFLIMLVLSLLVLCSCKPDSAGNVTEPNVTEPFFESEIDVLNPTEPVNQATEPVFESEMDIADPIPTAPEEDATTPDATELPVEGETEPEATETVPQETVPEATVPDTAVPSQPGNTGAIELPMIPG